MNSAESQPPRPLELDLQRTRSLHVKWSDGHESDYPLAHLRKACPCATCRTAREEQKSQKLVILKEVTNAAGMVIVDSAELVGNYAIRFVWQDGHDTGIFDFRLLRSLCPCDDCRAAAGGDPVSG